NWLISPACTSIVSSMREKEPMRAPIWSVLSTTLASILLVAATVSAVRRTVEARSRTTRPPAAMRMPVKPSSACVQSGSRAGTGNDAEQAGDAIVHAVGEDEQGHEHGQHHDEGDLPAEPELPLGGSGRVRRLVDSLGGRGAVEHHARGLQQLCQPSSA